MLAIHASGKQLGLGLIGIGRTWGHIPGVVPGEVEARRFLEFAFQAGIRYFDTAPSYGSSEQRFGAFLSSLTRSERATLTVATKFGEHWDSSRGEPYVDHTHDALVRSLERSASRLGTIDVLQLHKTTPGVLRSTDLERSWSFAASLGIRCLGPSVADVESARVACSMGSYQMMQLPLNSLDDRFHTLLQEIRSAGLWIAANRPFAMGRIAAEPSSDKTAAFRFLLDLPFDGVILSGTKSTAHLAENIEAFRKAQVQS